MNGYQSILNSYISRTALRMQDEKKLDTNKKGKSNSPITITSSSEETSVQCSICLDNIREKSKLLPCSHRFCQYCLFQWINVKLCCPVCRQMIHRLLFKNGHVYSEVNIDFKSPTIMRDQLYQNPIMVRVATKCLFAHFMDHNGLQIIDSTPIIKFDDLNRALNSSYNSKVVATLFRCLTYRYNLPAHRQQTSVNIKSSLSYIREHPSQADRLLDFIKLDLEVLPKILEIHIDKGILVEISKLLTRHDIATTTFRLNFRSLIRKFCPDHNIKSDLSYKIYYELCNFARDDSFTVLEYIQKTPYLFSPKFKKSTEVILLSESDSTSSVQILSDQGESSKRSREDDPTPGPSGMASPYHILPKKRKIVVPENQKPVRLYSKREIREMRRIIRNSRNSQYFFRKLLLEIKKKHYHYETILNSPSFSHLNDFFKDILVSSKLYDSKILNNLSSKRTLTLDEMNRRLNKNSTTSFSRSASSSQSDCVSHSEIALEQFENANQSKLNSEVVRHALSPSYSAASRLTRPQIVKVHFKNRVFSESD